MRKLFSGITLSTAIIFHLALGAYEYGDGMQYLASYIKDNVLISSIVLSVCCWFTNSLKYQEKNSRWIEIPALLFSVLSIIGNTFRKGTGIDFVFKEFSIEKVVFYIIILFGYYVLYSMLITCFWESLNKKGGEKYAKYLISFLKRDLYLRR